MGAILLCGMLIFSNSVEAQSRREKKAAKNAELEKMIKERRAELDRLKEQHEAAVNSSLVAEKTNAIPCFYESKSDDEYFRMFGTGEHFEQTIVQSLAQQDCQNRMIKQIGEIVNGLVVWYCRSDSKIGDNADLKGRFEQVLLDEAYSSISNFDQVCEEISLTDMGSYRCYYAVEIPKKRIIDNLINAISGDTNLKSALDIENFRQFAEEYLKSTKIQ